MECKGKTLRLQGMGFELLGAELLTCYLSHGRNGERSCLVVNSERDESRV